VPDADQLRAARANFVERLLDAARRDPRIVGVLDYGSTSEGRGDAWSDIDVALFIRDNDYVDFERDWQPWAAQLGPLAGTYVYAAGHPWAIYDADPLPLRVDFDLQRESDIAKLATWPNAPASVEAMVWHDATGSQLTAGVRQLVGKPLGPEDEAAAFEHVCGGFWYYVLRVYARLQRNQAWGARHELNTLVLGNLLALLRLEANAVERWQVLNAAVGIEDVLTPGRLAQLNACIPSAADDTLPAALRAAVDLGAEVCAALAARYGRTWPEVVARRMAAVL
jgi:hypothetical protein